MTEQVFSLLANNLENRLLGAKLLSGDILNHLVSLQALKGSSPSWSLQLEGIATSADTVESVHRQCTITAEPRAPMKKYSGATCAFHDVTNHGEPAFDGET